MERKDFGVVGFASSFSTSSSSITSHSDFPVSGSNLSWNIRSPELMLLAMAEGRENAGRSGGLRRRENINQSVENAKMFSGWGFSVGVKV